MALYFSTCQVVLLGDGGVGKSSLMRRFVSNEFDPQSFHTIGVEFLNKDITLMPDDSVNGDNIRTGHIRNNSSGGNKMKCAAHVQEETFTLQIWDTAGQERFKSLRTPFYRGADCCLLTYGIDDKESFANLSRWRQEFLHYADVSQHETDNFPFVVLGNKCDKISNVGQQTRAVSLDDAKTWCAANGSQQVGGQPLPHFETSALDATNVDAAFRAAVKCVVELEHSTSYLNTLQADTVKLSHKTNQTSSSGSCC